jgi:hypothetical protein
MNSQIAVVMREGHIISLSSCSSIWQCQTYLPAKPSNLTTIRVTVKDLREQYLFNPAHAARSIRTRLADRKAVAG